jgi:para-nitrobenzyl esterase
MKKLCLLFLTQALALTALAQTPTQIKISNGILEGTDSAGIRSFKGVPFAAPPVGDLRWKEPQPVKNWTGVRKAVKFGPKAMQKPIFGDMMFRANGTSEDCLYLNVWTPAKSANQHLPVLVYFYGGGMVAGDGSELRYDGESLARKGIVTITITYRLGVFGFLAHPELTKESPHHASGDYGLLDQHAALEWVHQNIAAFGGDPNHVVIAGESAGSASVFAQMASPLSKNLIAGAIGESGAAINPTMAPIPLAEAEQKGVEMANKLGAQSLEALRAIPADQLLDQTFNAGYRGLPCAIDGYFWPELPLKIFEEGKQAHVPLLVGWNSGEMNYQSLLRGEAPTPENYEKTVKALYGDKADEVLKLYPATTDADVLASATALASDRFIVYSTWKWADEHTRTSGQPVYNYIFARPRPAMRPEMGNATAGLAGGVIKGNGAAKPNQTPVFKGAVHSAEIEYALGNLSTNKVYAWMPEDYKVSRTMEAYFANFIKKLNPNGNGLPMWKANTDPNHVSVMHIDVDSRLEPEQNRARYLFLDQQYSK